MPTRSARAPGASAAPPSPIVAAVRPPGGAEDVERARAGDVAAFERLYRANAGRIFATCLRMTADPGQAEEATQDAFVKAWARLDGFRGRAAFSSWLHRLAVNVVLDRKRSEKRWAKVFAPGEPDDDGPGGTAAPRPEDALDLERAIATLPPGARTAFVLHDVEGYKHREIAEMTGTAEGTWKAQLHRARRLLRERLER